jgi:hypothetical protein
MKTIIGSHPPEKDKEKEGLQLPHCPLSVLKALVIYFSPNAPHHIEQNHLPHSFILRITKLPSPTSKEISHTTRHNHAKLNNPKIEDLKALAVSQRSKWWSTVSTLFLTCSTDLLQ